MAKYVCSVCGFIYDGDQEGISWDAVPRDWACPGCGSDEFLFNRLDDDKATTQEPATSDVQAPPIVRNTPIEPTLELIHSLARDGLEKVGHHGPMGAMGVPRPTFPQWDDIQILPAQLARKPLAEDVGVGTELVIGPNAQKPLRMETPIFVSDVSFGALTAPRES
jgi:methylamine---glutamate N-methyltransferase subunit C